MRWSAWWWCFVLTTPVMAQDVQRDAQIGIDQVTFVVGHALLADQQAALVQATRAQIAADPAKEHRNAEAIAAWLGRARNAGPAGAARYREAAMNAVLYGPRPEPLDRPFVDMMVRANPIAAHDDATRLVLTQRAVGAFVESVNMLAERGGRGPLPADQRQAIAANIPAAFTAAPGPQKAQFAYAESRYLTLRANLDASSPAQQAELRRQVAQAADGPALVRLTASYLNTANRAAPQVARGGPGCAVAYICDPATRHNFNFLGATFAHNPHL